MIARSAAALLLLAVLLLATTGASGAAAGATTPTVRPGAFFPVVVGGFGPGVPVTVQQVGLTGGQQREAGRDGVLRTTWRAPRLAGSYRLVVTGAPRLSGARRSGNVEAVVPRLVTVPFRVVPPGGSSGGSGTQGAGGSQGGGSGSGLGPQGGGGRVAHTGSDLEAVLGVGDLLLLAGIAALAVGLRGRRAGRA